jgi:NAD(P)-dependent dehydrogenase (short-subunit alcohol dehydrogenase family)
MTSSYESSDLIVVTGASTGIGAATARELASRGFHVLGGVRRDSDADALRAPGLEPVILDITDAEHIRALAERVHRDRDSRPLRAVVNNAGIAVNVPVEVYPLDDWRRLFEVNLFGHVAVIQALLPALIRSRGRIVNISSVGGKGAMATYGPYAATKFGMEAISDALRRELRHTGVDVVVVEPGAVRTEMPGRAIAAIGEYASTMNPEQQRRYGPLLHAIAAQTSAHTDTGVPAETAAAVIATAISARTPRTRYTVGADAAVITRLVRVLPDRLLDALLAAALRPHRAPRPA